MWEIVSTICIFSTGNDVDVVGFGRNLRNDTVVVVEVEELLAVTESVDDDIMVDGGGCFGGPATVRVTVPFNVCNTVVVTTSESGC
jgi:hypothetical protein